MADTQILFLLLAAAAFQLSLCSVAHFGGSRHDNSIRLDQDKNSISPDSIEVDNEATDNVPFEDKEWVHATRISPKVQTFSQGDRIEIECEAEGKPPPTIQWMHGRESILQDEANAISNLLTTESSSGLAKIKSRLVLDCAQPTHQGTYTCVAQAGGQTALASPATVLVAAAGAGSSPANVASCRRGDGPQRAPRITSWAPVLMKFIGSDVVLPCATDGGSRPAIYWLDSDSQMVTSRRFRFQVLSSGALHIRKLRWDDMGRYTCVAQNGGGRDTADTFLYPVTA